MGGRFRHHPQAGTYGIGRRPWEQKVKGGELTLQLEHS